MSVTFDGGKQFSLDEVVNGTVTIIPHADQQIDRVEIRFIINWKVPYLQDKYTYANIPVTEHSEWKKDVAITYPIQFKVNALSKACIDGKDFGAIVLSHMGSIIKVTWELQFTVYFEDAPSEAIDKTQDFKVVPATNSLMTINKNNQFYWDSKGIRLRPKHIPPRPRESYLMSWTSLLYTMFTGKELPRKKISVPVITPTFEPCNITLSPPLDSDDNNLHFLIQSDVLKSIYVNSIEIRFSVYERCRVRFVTEKKDFSGSIYAHSKMIPIHRAFQPGEQLSITTIVPVNLIDLPSTFELSVGDADSRASVGWYVSMILDHPDVTTRSEQRFIARHTKFQIQLPE